jgi:hypothetical protein
MLALDADRSVQGFYGQSLANKKPQALKECAAAWLSKRPKHYRSTGTLFPGYGVAAGSFHIDEGLDQVMHDVHFPRAYGACIK